jgi:hypothetical protein
MTWDPLDQMAALISSHVNTDRHRDAITDSGPTGPGIFYTHARNWLFTLVSQSLVAGSLGLIQEQNGDSVF